MYHRLFVIKGDNYTPFEKQKEIIAPFENSFFEQEKMFHLS
jgi:hypothetical protein